MSEQPFVQEGRRYLSLINKRRGLLAACLGVSLLVAVLYNYSTRPVYQATAQVLIDRDTPKVLPTAREVTEMSPGGADYFQTQYQLLGGRLLAEKVVERLNLHKSAELQAGPLMTPWERFERRFLGRAPGAGLDSAGMPLSPAVAAFRSRLSIQPVLGSRLVNVRFSAYDPGLAARVVNTLAQLYIEQSLEFRYTTSSEATDWLAQRLKEQEKKVEEAEKALQEYRERQGLVNLEERQGLADQRLSALNLSVMTARAERIAKETLHNQMRSLPSSQLESFPLVMSSGLVQGLKTQMAELQREEARLAETLGDKHPDMIRVRSQIKSTEEELRAEIQKIVRSVESDYRTARQQEASLQANLEAVKQEALEINRKGIEYNALKREVEGNQQLFRNLMNRSKESGLETELKSTNIRIVEKAEPPRAPILPQKQRNLQIAFIVGLGLGIGLTLLFERLDNTLKTPEDVKQHLRLPFLGMIPEVDSGSRPGQGPPPSLLVAKNATSAVAEAYRILRTNLIFSSAETTGRALVVASANEGEGKTTTVSNLASSLSLNGARVLALDADLRRPALHQHFGVPKGPGLADLIVGKCQPSDAIKASRLKGLHVLPCGSPSPNPAELLGSTRMREIVRAFRMHYDWILIDTPPILPMADTAVLSPVVDGIILVVGSEISGRPTIQRAIDQVKSVGGKVLGVVLNRVDVKRHSYYYGPYYGSYSAAPPPRPAVAPAARPRLVRRS